MTTAELLSREPLVLEFGCGPTKQEADAVGIDISPYRGVDIVADAFDVLGSIPDNRVDRIFSSHFIEHLPDACQYVRECARVLKPGGLLKTVAPHWSNPYFYSDPTHRSFWGLYSMCYFGTYDIFRRDIRAYEDQRFHIENVTLVFRTASAFPVRNVFRHLIHPILNSSRWVQEFYEESLAHLLGCYEIEYVLRKL